MPEGQRFVPASRQSLTTYENRQNSSRFETQIKKDKKSPKTKNKRQHGSYLEPMRTSDKEFSHSESEEDTDDDEDTDNSNNADNSDDRNLNKYVHHDKSPNIRTNIIKTQTEQKIKHDIPSQANGSFISLTIIICIGLVIIVFAYSDKTDNFDQNDCISLDLLRNTFPNQTEDLWLAIEAGVQDIKRFHKPRTMLLLYHENLEIILENILNNISKFIIYQIKNDCKEQPITLTSGILNSNDFVDDYGKIVHKYKSELERKGVMVIKNLELVSGSSAPAFHVFCDEYSPFVEDSFIIFTMKINRYHDSNIVKFVGNYLRDVWSNVDNDKFYPLLTRITNVILEIAPE